MNAELDTTYTPFLKGKASELRALAGLGVEEKLRLRPLFDVPPEKVKFSKDEQDRKWIQIPTVEEAISGYAAKLVAAWGTLDHCLVDLAGFDPSLRLPGGIHPMAAFLAEARAVDLAAVPVTGLERDDEQVAAVRDAAGTWPPLGAAIRLRGPVLTDPAALAPAIMDLVGRLGLEPDQVDLLVDLGAITRSNAEVLAVAAPRLVEALPALQDWRSLVLCSGAYPFEVGNLVKKNKTELLPRRDWRLWSELASGGSPARLPSFADCGVTRADWSSPFDFTEMSVSAKIIYAIDTDWVVVKGESAAANSRQYHDLAERLRRHPDFLDPSHCSTEQAVIHCATNRDDGPGNAENWLALATRHHIEVVSRQLAKLA